MEASKPIREIDPAWAERLDKAVERFERVERRAAWRRAALSVVLALLVVTLGLEGFRYETDTRTKLLHNGSLVWVEIGGPGAPSR